MYSTAIISGHHHLRYIYFSGVGWPYMFVVIFCHSTARYLYLYCGCMFDRIWKPLLTRIVLWSWSCWIGCDWCWHMYTASNVINLCVMAQVHAWVSKEGCTWFRYVAALEQVFLRICSCRPPPPSFHPGPYSYHCDGRVPYKVRKLLLHSSFLDFTLSKLALV
jgi:hypothetical protein